MLQCSCQFLLEYVVLRLDLFRGYILAPEQTCTLLVIRKATIVNARRQHHFALAVVASLKLWNFRSHQNFPRFTSEPLAALNLSVFIGVFGTFPNFALTLILPVLIREWQQTFGLFDFSA